ncbi:MAG: hypothetical protein AB7P04_13700 [Bacteriovoracia bacterium]
MRKPEKKYTRRDFVSRASLLALGAGLSPWLRPYFFDRLIKRAGADDALPPLCISIAADLGNLPSAASLAVPGYALNPSDFFGTPIGTFEGDPYFASHYDLAPGLVPGTPVIRSYGNRVLRLASPCASWPEDLLARTAVFQGAESMTGHAPQTDERWNTNRKFPALANCYQHRHSGRFAFSPAVELLAGGALASSLYAPAGSPATYDVPRLRLVPGNAEETLNQARLFVEPMPATTSFSATEASAVVSAWEDLNQKYAVATNAVRDLSEVLSRIGQAYFGLTQESLRGALRDLSVDGVSGYDEYGIATAVAIQGHNPRLFFWLSELFLANGLAGFVSVSTSSTDWHREISITNYGDSLYVLQREYAEAQRIFHARAQRIPRLGGSGESLADGTYIHRFVRRAAHNNGSFADGSLAAGTLIGPDVLGGNCGDLTLRSNGASREVALLGWDPSTPYGPPRPQAANPLQVTASLAQALECDAFVEWCRSYHALAPLPIFGS